MTRIKGWTPVLGLALAVTAGCSDDTTEPTTMVACTNGTVVAVSTGTTPTFSWAPQCSVAGLFVQRISDGSNMWTLSTSTAVQISSPVVYGVVPTGATGISSAPLAAGVPYRVGVVNAAGVAIAVTQFTP